MEKDLNKTDLQTNVVETDKPTSTISNSKIKISKKN